LILKNKKEKKENKRKIKCFLSFHEKMINKKILFTSLIFQIPFLREKERKKDTFFFFQGIFKKLFRKLRLTPPAGLSG
jgi:hypothetical protein